MRILLVEDDPLIGNGLCLGLKREGYAVDWDQDGDTASLALRTTTYGLLLLDLGLPSQDGLKVLRELRRSGDATPTIILTARDAVEQRIAGLDSGADDYLVKPFALGELLARIRALTRRHAGRVQPELKVGAVRLDPMQHRVWIADIEVQVTPREFALLQELMQRPDAVLRREKLEQAIYGWEEEVESNAIQVHVFNLRKKFGAGLIRTVRGVGYRIGSLS